MSLVLDKSIGTRSKILRHMTKELLTDIAADMLMGIPYLRGHLPTICDNSNNYSLGNYLTFCTGSIFIVLLTLGPQ